MPAGPTNTLISNNIFFFSNVPIPFDTERNGKRRYRDPPPPPRPGGFFNRSVNRIEKRTSLEVWAGNERNSFELINRWNFSNSNGRRNALFSRMEKRIDETNLRMKWKKGWGKVDDEISSLVGASGVEEERGREGFANGERTFRSIGGRDDEESCGGVRFQVSCT